MATCRFLHNFLRSPSLVLLALLFGVPAVNAQQYFQVSGTVVNVDGSPVGNAVMSWTPVLAPAGPPLLGGLTGGAVGTQQQFVGVAKQVQIPAGSGGGFTPFNLVNTAVSYPQNFCYHVVIQDGASGDTIFDYPCVQFDNSSANAWCDQATPVPHCYFDQYHQPNYGPLAAATPGPAGPAGATGAQGPEGPQGVPGTLALGVAGSGIVGVVNGSAGLATAAQVRSVVSPLDISIAAECASAGPQADLNTGLTPAGGAAGDYGPCITALAATAAQTGVGLKVDGAFKVSGVALPKAGGVRMYGLGGGMNKVKITAWSVSGNVATFTTLPNSLAVNNTVMLGLFGSGTFFNANAVRVLSASATQFTANFTHANGSATDTGEADYLTGTGLIAAAGTNNDLIHNGTYGSNCYTDPGTATPGLAPGRGNGLILTDMVLNGWGGTLTGTNGNSTSGIRQGNLANYTGPYTSTACNYENLNIRDMENAKIDDVYFFNPPAHELDLSNVGHAQVTNSGFDTWYPNQPLISSDGVHIDGPSNDIAIGNITCRTGECIAMNAPEGWSGAISGVNINGVVDDGSNNIIRLYASSVAPPSGTATAYIDGVTATNIQSRNPSIIPIIIGVETARSSLTVSEAVRNIKIANSYIMGPYAVTLADNIGQIDFTNIAWRQSSCSSAVPFIASTVNSTVGTAITATNVRALRTPGAGNCVNGFLNTSSGGYPGAGVAMTLGTLTINGFAVSDIEGATNGAMGALLILGSGSSVGQYNRANIDWTNITDPASGVGVGPTQGSPFLFDGPSNQVMSRYRGGGGAPIANQNLWDCLYSNSSYVCRAINDANTAATSWLEVDRSGTTITAIKLNGPLTVSSCSGCGNSTPSTSGPASQTVTLGAGSGVTAACASGFVCTSLGGLLTLSGTVTGLLTSVSWPTSVSGIYCRAAQEQSTSAQISYTYPNGTSFSIYGAISGSINVDYTCTPQ